MPEKHILFVDDDENVLSGLQRQLRTYRDQWDQSFAKTGSQALKILTEKPVDLIVSDISLSDMLVTELFGQIKAHYPGVVRVILSAHTDENTLKNGLNIAHQYLSKPCNPEVLREAISQIFKIRDSLRNPKIVKELGEATHLPSLPKIYQQLQRAINQEATTQEIATIFSRDMVLSAKLLQLVNSPYFGLNRRISNLTEAINLVGVKKLSNLVLSVHVRNAFPPQTPETARYIEYLWQDAAQVSELAYRIALLEDLPEDRPDQSYLGGLLHNMGLLIFLSQGGNKLKQLIERSKNKETPITDLETELFGFTRSEAATYVLSLWKIPPRIIEAVLLQYRPNDTDFDGMNALTAVHVAASLLKPGNSESYESLFGVTLDEQYLSRIDKIHRLPKWQSTAHAIFEQVANAL